ncbi:hypothetical protein JCM15457_2021 [Liquorilactobacillus sucicola DSM 21376 = JCM 15457]|nr:hypothetical protein JCM15457_2021 [Liquorilactobacillus sucicola DSM 21376 = JCM 15457]
MVVGDFEIELDTVVVGAGPGGYVAAIRAAEKGQKGYCDRTRIYWRSVLECRLYSIESTD